MATQLGLYNAALRLIGERKLATISDAVESRRVLDDVYANGFINHILFQGFWKFALRTALLENDPDVSISFGFDYAFAQPDDMVREYKICHDEYLGHPLMKYNEEGGLWYADVDQLYVSYVSNDAAYGADLSRWPPGFYEYASRELAAKIVERLAPDKNVNDFEIKAKLALDNALAKDAMKGQPEFPPAGSWISSRGHGRSRRDRGRRGDLIG